MQTFRFIPVLLVMWVMPCPLVLADQCPTPEQVREREISRDYDWSVGETVTLDMLLEITELQKVSLNNHGEFISCHYLSGQLPVRMDGAALKPNCFVYRLSEEWIPMPGGVLSCNEAEPVNCRFQIRCFESNLPDPAQP